MNKQDCFNLGHVSRTVGLKGGLEFFLDVDVPDNYKKLESVFIEINEQLIPFFITQVQIKKNRAIVQLEGIENINKAEAFVKAALYLPLTKLPPLKGKNFYFHEIIGFKVIDKIYGDIGMVESILDFPQQNILQIKNGPKEILIPARREFINEVDRGNKIIKMEAPPGLIDVYLDKPI